MTESETVTYNSVYSRDEMAAMIGVIDAEERRYIPNMLALVSYLEVDDEINISSINTGNWQDNVNRVSGKRHFLIDAEHNITHLHDFVVRMIDKEKNVMCERLQTPERTGKERREDLSKLYLDFLHDRKGFYEDINMQIQKRKAQFDDYHWNLTNLVKFWDVKARLR